jgi:hypothetical protein
MESPQKDLEVPKKVWGVWKRVGGLEEVLTEIVMSVEGLRGPLTPFIVTFHSWSGSHLRWGQPLRIRHVTTGRYLALTEDQGLVVVDANKAHTKATAFCFRISKVSGGQGTPPSRGALCPCDTSLSSAVSLCGSPINTHMEETDPCPLPLQEKLDVAPKRDVEGMGPPEIKYGESLCFVQHVTSGLWLTYAAPDPKALRLGVLKKKVNSAGIGRGLGQ